MKCAIWISFSLTAGLLLCLILIQDPAAWPAPEPIPYQGEAADLTNPEHSGAALARLVREPQNTWSNLAFIYGGALLIGTRRMRLTRMMGLPLIAVGLGSFLYHASASAALRQLDVGAMYWLFLMAAVFCASVRFPRVASPGGLQIAGMLIGTLAAALAFTLARNVVVFGVKPLSLTVATAISAAIMLLSVARVALKTESVAAALQLLGIVTVFGVAVYLQTGDRPGRALYRPEAAVQAHAMWHLLAAGVFVWAVVVLERYGNRSEERAPA